MSTILSKLDLPESAGHNRRVQAALVYLAWRPTAWVLRLPTR